MTDALLPASPDAGDPIARIVNEMMDRALGSSDLERMFAEACRKFDATVLPLSRAHVSMPTLHPLIDFTSMTWKRGEGVAHSEITQTHTQTDNWQASPFHRMMEIDREYVRYYDLSASGHDFPVLNEIRGEGATGYLALVHGFSSPLEQALEKRDGMISSWATDRPGGFNEQAIVALQRLASRLAVCAKLHVRERTARNILDAYLGGDAGRRVMDGQIKLGDGELIRAAIWYSDMRGSTPLADRFPPEIFHAVLNDYFDATASAVLDAGGEVLRFIGDAVLAIFRIDDNHSPEQAASAALIAARDATKRLQKHNSLATGAGAVQIEMGIGLHLGDVLFGNIGVPGRIEFSVIGPAANEVARLEDLTRSLGHAVILSRAFAAQLPNDVSLISLGPQTLRGVTRPIEVFSIDE